jgi:hypothetical protein
MVAPRATTASPTSGKPRGHFAGCDTRFESGGTRFDSGGDIRFAGGATRFLSGDTRFESGSAHFTIRFAICESGNCAFPGGGARFEIGEARVETRHASFNGGCTAFESNRAIFQSDCDVLKAALPLPEDETVFRDFFNDVSSAGNNLRNVDRPQKREGSSPALGPKPFGESEVK